MTARRALWRFVLLCLWALFLQGIPLLFLSILGDKGLALYFLYLYLLMPLTALLLPAWAGAGGVHPLAAFFPIGSALLLLPVYESVGMGLVCLLLSLIGAVAGQEWAKRKQPQKGGHHGKKARKK